MDTLNLKEGDIFIFQAEDDFISKCIAYITNSDVSHAAMIYRDFKLVEMGAPGLCVNSFHECLEGNKVTVMRMKPDRESMPILKAAESYINSGIKYDYPQLVLLAGLILYWPFRPTHILRKTIEKILKAACLKLDDLLNQLIHKENEKVMMCSQLVYQCYMDCGEDYIIDIENGVLQGNENTIRLIDLNFKYQSEDKGFVNLTTLEPLDEEKLAEDLYKLLIGQDNEAESLNETELQELCIYADYFHEKLNKLNPFSYRNKPLESLFVTPADLRYHAINLEKVGELRIIRDR